MPNKFLNFFEKSGFGGLKVYKHLFFNSRAIITICPLGWGDPFVETALSGSLICSSIKMCLDSTGVLGTEPPSPASAEWSKCSTLTLC